MCRGQRLAGRQARERVVAILAWLCTQGAVTSAADANALLAAAGMAPLRPSAGGEQSLLERLNAFSRQQTVPLDRLLRTNLPAPLTSFVGRTREVAEIGKLLADYRLVTLIGPAGVGKSRLALAVALATVRRQADNGFEDGIWLVDLEPAGAPLALLPAVVAALSLPEDQGRVDVDGLVTRIADKRMLLLMDNCDNLTLADFTTLERLLLRCWQLQVLATRVTPLPIAGGVAYSVAPLALPADDLAPRAVILANPSVRLFVERLAMFQPGQQLSDEELWLVGRICRRLGGMPLAIELAAGLTETLTLAEIAARLRA